MTSPISFFTISTDVVLFSIRNERLEVLLVKRQDEVWKLPGGSLAVNEDLDASALRHLQEQAGLRGVYLEQLYTFGHPDRNPPRRVISVAYYALVPLHQLCLCGSSVDEEPCWFTIDNTPPINPEHSEIIAMAHRRLAAKLMYSTIALHFMPKRFTLSALQSVYETILGETLDKRNFRKRVLSMGCIEATGELSREGNHRPARLYRVKKPGKVEFIK